MAFPRPTTSLVYPFPLPSITVSTVPNLPTLPTTSRVASTRSTTPRTRTISTPVSTATDVSSSESKNLSGGAIAGLVVGILVVLIGSVFGGMVLLKKRRKRMMLSGRGSSYNNGSYPAKREAMEDSNQESTSFGDKVSGFFAGMTKKSKTDVAQGSVPDPYSNYNRYQSGLPQVSSPGGVPLPRMVQRTSSPVPSSLGGSVAAYPYPTHQSGALPPVADSLSPVFSQPYQAPPAQYLPLSQPPVSSVPGSTVHPGPGNQHYVYQPGTGLVSVPLSLPHSAPPPQLPHVSQPYQQQPISIAHPIQASFVPPPATLLQQSHQQSHQQPQLQQQQQQLQHQHQQQYQYQPPPVQSQNVVPQAQPMVSFPLPTASATPVSSSIFLPGDASRPLLGQGLFKIVPDAEDVEEEKRAAAARQGGTDSTPLQSVELNLGGDILSSVINYKNQEQRFEALEHQTNGANSRRNNGLSSREITVPIVNGPAGEIQEYTRTSTYDDRSASKQSQSAQHVQGEGDKQELEDDETSSMPSPVVIVGSDIVFEPLPSMKAAAAAVAAAAGVSVDSKAPTPPESKSSGTSSEAVSSPSSCPSTLTRMTNIGRILPTMGTEEYLERTDDKEEYSFGLHGDRRDIVGPPSSSVASPIAPPPIVRSTKPKPA